MDSKTTGQGPSEEDRGQRLRGFCSVAVVMKEEEEQQPQKNRKKKSCLLVLVVDTCELCLGASQAKAKAVLSFVFPFDSGVSINEQRRRTHLVSGVLAGYR